MAVNRACQFCSERFEVTDKRRIFCSDRCKTRYHRQEKLTCWYCGELGDTTDHMFPQSKGGKNGDTVIACRECNNAMNDLHAKSVGNRIKHLIDRYTRRHKLDRLIPEWDDEEIAELDASLRSAVKGKIYARQRAIERVLHLQGRLLQLDT